MNWQQLGYRKMYSCNYSQGTLGLRKNDIGFSEEVAPFIYCVHPEVIDEEIKGYSTTTHEVCSLCERYTPASEETLNKLIPQSFTKEPEKQNMNDAAMRATHKVIASYYVANVDERIVLLKQAVTEYPKVYNGYNTLGYAYLERGDIEKAIEAFEQAIKEHPDDKAGYCDLAYACFLTGNDDRSIKWFRKAISIDPSARKDIMRDMRISAHVKVISCYDGDIKIAGRQNDTNKF